MPVKKTNPPMNDDDSYVRALLLTFAATILAVISFMICMLVFKGAFGDLLYKIGYYGLIFLVYINVRTCWLKNKNLRKCFITLAFSLFGIVISIIPCGVIYVIALPFFD
jgi:hypothetical protein